MTQRNKPIQVGEREAYLDGNREPAIGIVTEIVVTNHGSFLFLSWNQAEKFLDENELVYVSFNNSEEAVVITYLLRPLFT